MNIFQDPSQQHPNFRQAGKEKSGKLLKGVIQDPLGKSHTASIPYKFETILYQNPNPRGFGASAQRFFNTEEVAPGPGAYTSPVTKDQSGCPSFSKKGYGSGFVSKSTRNLYTGFINTGPGPGSYTVKEQPFRVTHITPDTSMISSKTFNTSESRTKLIKSDAPGPGQYDAEKVQTSRISNARSVTSVFRSTSLRETQSVKNIVAPPPGTYNIDRGLLEKKPFKHFFGSADFMLPSKKKINEEQAKRIRANELLGKEPDTKAKVPGPGQYFQNKDEEVVLFNQRLNDKSSSAFMNGNQTRFGEVIEKKAKKFDTPGPGQYGNVVTYPTDRALVSGSVFMSETARKPFGDNVRNMVGPTKYNPEPLPKKSYHLNISKNWV